MCMRAFDKFNTFSLHFEKLPFALYKEICCNLITWLLAAFGRIHCHSGFAPANKKKPLLLDYEIPVKYDQKTVQYVLARLLGT